VVMLGLGLMGVISQDRVAIKGRSGRMLPLTDEES